jgi:hypothetical protein
MSQSGGSSHQGSKFDALFPFVESTPVLNYDYGLTRDCFALLGTK